ncbi:MAG: aromatic ring-hydroxylating dioxygenase subunit alpha [Hyphomicrobiales bacterium]|nr:aromatic ring-hydroxylating dioxygenase subunit alpha [Hyphomicrobiales bacterium]MBV9112377.1 aromatic ring-hydroxylating dioxygenase subunit alpha [Hyphomicrobiales bacterium]
MSIHTSAAPETVAARIADIVRRQPKAHSLHQALYDSPEAFQHDMERIFLRHWILAGHESSAPNPGDWFLHEMAEESIIIMRGKDGRLRAFVNVCRHRGSRICRTATGHASVLVCPYHAWSYELDGSLRAARHMPADFDKSSHGLKPIHLEVIEGLVFISLAEKPLSLDAARSAISAAYGAYGWGSAKVAQRETYVVAANWKLAVENYLECYHCTPAHPEYSKLHALERPLEEIADLNAAMEARSRALGVKVPGIDHRVASSTGEASVFTFRYALYDGVKTGAPDGKPVAPLMGDFGDYDGGVTSTHFAPSSFFIAYPDHGVLYRFLPLAPKSSILELVWLVRGDARESEDYDLDKLTWLWKVTSEADKRITEDAQKGVSSRFYEPGPYSPTEPNAIAWIAWYLSEIA